MKDRLTRGVLKMALTAVVILVIPLCAGAWTNPPQGPPHGGPRAEDMLAKFDADGDGQLSAEEFPGPADHFTRMDTDEDGILTAEELTTARPESPRGTGFERDDADGDGIVSLDEFSGPEDLFDRLDANGDGIITKEEADSMRPHGDPMGEP